MRNAEKSVSDAVNTALNVLTHSANTVLFVKIVQAITDGAKHVTVADSAQLSANVKQAA